MAHNVGAWADVDVHNPATVSNHRTRVATLLTAASLPPSLKSGLSRLSSCVHGMVRKQISDFDFRYGDAVRLGAGVVSRSHTAITSDSLIFLRWKFMTTQKARTYFQSKGHPHASQSGPLSSLPTIQQLPSRRLTYTHSHPRLQESFSELLLPYPCPHPF